MFVLWKTWTYGGMDMKITLKDGSFREYAQAMRVYDIAADISGGLEIGRAHV